MANSAQARKRARQAEVAREHNASCVPNTVPPSKKVLKAVLAGDKAAAQEVFKSSVAVIDRIADKSCAHGTRLLATKSRLSAKIKALAA